MTAAPPPPDTHAPATHAPVDQLRTRLTDLATDAGPVALRGAIAVLEALAPTPTSLATDNELPPPELGIKSYTPEEVLPLLERRAPNEEPTIDMETALALAEERALARLEALKV